MLCSLSLVSTLVISCWLGIDEDRFGGMRMFSDAVIWTIRSLVSVIFGCCMRLNLLLGWARDVLAAPASTLCDRKV